MTNKTRPFVSGRQLSSPAQPVTLAPSRPFSFTGARTSTTGAMTTASSMVKTRDSMPTPRWTVAVYQPDLEHVTAPSSSVAQSRDVTRPSWMTSPTDNVVEASLALADDVIEAGRHASSLAAAEVLEVVARRLRTGEILLLPGASTKTEAAVVSSVLAALLGGRR